MTTTYAADQAETLHHQRSTRPRAARRATAPLRSLAFGGEVTRYIGRRGTSPVANEVRL